MRDVRNRLTKMHPQLGPSLVATALASALLLGCAASPYVTHAKKGEVKELSGLLKKKLPEQSETRKTAAALLRYDIEHAKDSEDRAFVRSVSSCKEPLIGALKKRSTQHDGTGAEAAMILLEAGRLGKNPHRFSDDPDGGWRALAARATKSRPDERRAFMVDPDQRVRRAALLAAVEAHDPEDLEALLEVARLDPDPLSRSHAFLAVSGIGGQKTVRALRDRYAPADEALKLAIVEAWKSDALLDAGGQAELLSLVTHETGLPSVVAASFLARKDDPEVANLAIARLTRMALEGAVDERRLALRLMPLSTAETTSAFLKAKDDPDPTVAVIAWARLLGHDKYKKLATDKLTAWAKSDDPVAPQAQAALAVSEHMNIAPVLTEGLKHPDAATRILAAQGLIALGDLPQAALLLGDTDAEVRHQVACHIISRAPLTPSEP